MKKINSLLIGVSILFAGFFTTSCNKDTTNDATIGLVAGTGYITESTTVAAGSTLKFKWTATSTPNMKYISIARDGVALSGDGWSYKAIDSNYENAYNGEASLTAPLSGGPYVYAIIVYDKDQTELARVEVTITITAAVTINSYTATLYNGLWYTDAGSGAFIDLETGTTYSQTGSGALLSSTDQAKVDLLYWYGSSTTYTLAAPNDAVAQGSQGAAATKNWTVRNATKLKTVTISETWDNLTVANIDSYATGFGSDTKLTGLSVGQIIAFQTVGGKNGLIKVDALNGTSGSKTDNASLSIKVEQ